MVIGWNIMACAITRCYIIYIYICIYIYIYIFIRIYIYLHIRIELPKYPVSHGDFQPSCLCNGLNCHQFSANFATDFARHQRVSLWCGFPTATFSSQSMRPMGAPSRWVAALKGTCEQCSTSPLGWWLVGDYTFFHIIMMYIYIYYDINNIIYMYIYGELFHHPIV